MVLLFPHSPFELFLFAHICFLINKTPHRSFDRQSRFNAPSYRSVFGYMKLLHKWPFFGRPINIIDEWKWSPSSQLNRLIVYTLTIRSQLFGNIALNSIQVECNSWKAIDWKIVATIWIQKFVYCMYMIE